jgi:hypothetical protein
MDAAKALLASLVNAVVSAAVECSRISIKFAPCPKNPSVTK